MEDYKTWAVGDEVVCIRDERSTSLIHKGVVSGEKYKIQKIDVLTTGLHIWVRNERGAYKVQRFRKLQKRKTDISVFTAMLNQTELTNKIELEVKERVKDVV